MNKKNRDDAQLNQEDIKRIYSNIAGIYDYWGNLAEAKARKRGIELAGIQDGESVLDVAVGSGLILSDVIRLNPSGFNAGIDISEGMLKRTREKLANSTAHIEIKSGSAFEIPYPESKFDLVINGYMFDLMPFESMPKILAEFKRVLKDDGRLVLMNMTIGERFGGQIIQWLYHLSPYLMGGCRGVRLAEPLRKAGFKVMTREYYQQNLFPSEVILAKPA